MKTNKNLLWRKQCRTLLCNCWQKPMRNFYRYTRCDRTVGFYDFPYWWELGPVFRTPNCKMCQWDFRQFLQKFNRFENKYKQSWHHSSHTRSYCCAISVCYQRHCGCSYQNNVNSYAVDHNSKSDQQHNEKL